MNISKYEKNNNIVETRIGRRNKKKKFKDKKENYKQFKFQD